MEVTVKLDKQFLSVEIEPWGVNQRLHWLCGRRKTHFRFFWQVWFWKQGWARHQPEEKQSHIGSMIWVSRVRHHIVQPPLSMNWTVVLPFVLLEEWGRPVTWNEDVFVVTLMLQSGQLGIMENGIQHGRHCVPDASAVLPVWRNLEQILIRFKHKHVQSFLITVWKSRKNRQVSWCRKLKIDHDLCLWFGTDGTAQKRLFFYLFAWNGIRKDPYGYRISQVWARDPGSLIAGNILLTFVSFS